MRSNLMIKVLSAFLMTTLICSCSDWQKIQKTTDIELKKDAAFRYFDAGDYYKASLLLEEIIPLLKGKNDAEKAQYYYAYAQYYERNLTLSAYYFQKFYETFPRSKNAEESMYMHAMSLYESSPKASLDQTNTIEAIEAMTTFLNKHPESDYGDRCVSLIETMNAKLELKDFANAKLYHNMEEYKTAIVMFENFKNKWPNSDYKEEAEFLRIESQYKLSKVSIESKKKERYLKTIDFYQIFVDTYPESGFIKQAESMYRSSLKYLDSIN